MIKTKWLVSLLLFLSFFFLSDCSRFKKKEKKKSPIFQVYVPLEEDYPLLKNGLFSIIQLSFPNPNIVLGEGLSGKYEIAQFEDWITRTDPDFLLKLKISFEKVEDFSHLAAFLNRDELTFPFKVKLPKSEVLGSEFRGESLFCRMQIVGQDILSRQVCRLLQQALCPKDLRPQAKRLLNLAPANCEMILEKPQALTNSESELSSKSFILTGFPLPLKVKGEYPFTRLVEVDEALLLNLFGPAE